MFAGRERALQPLPHLVSAGVDELVREVDRSPQPPPRRPPHRETRCRPWPRPPGRSGPGSPREAPRRVELGRVGDEVVVEVGEPLLANLLDRRPEAPLLSGQRVGLVVGRELDLHGHLVPRRGVRQRAVELRQQALRSQLDHQIGRLRALERLAVRSARVVDQHQVPVRGGPVHGLEAGEALAQPVELGLDRVLGHVGRRACPPRAPCTRRASPPAERRPRS